MSSDSQDASVVKAVLEAGDDPTLAELEAALAAANKSSAETGGTDHFEAIGMLEGNIALIHRREAENAPEKLELSLRWFQRSLKNLQRGKHGLLVGYAHLNLAAAFEMRKVGDSKTNSAAAIKHYDLALHVFKDEGDLVDIADARRSLARIFIKWHGKRGLRGAIGQYELLIEEVGHSTSLRPAIDRELDDLRKRAAYRRPWLRHLLSKLRLPKKFSRPDGDLPTSFSATLPPETEPDSHHMAPNPALDRPGGIRGQGIDASIPMFTTKITGVKKGLENAARLIAMSNNAMSETDVERRLSALRDAHAVAESIKDDPNAAEAIADEKGKLLGSIAATLMARPTGNADRNRREAIKFYKLAMQHFIDHNDHKYIVVTKYNLADAYAAGVGSDDRSEGRLALQYLRETIKEASPVEDGELASRARLNFGSYVQRLADEEPDLIDEAIGYAKDVATIVSRNQDPAVWSSAMNTLGALYTMRTSGDRSRNLQLAVWHFEQSLEERTKERAPEQWAVTVRNLMGTKRRLAQEFESGDGKYDADYATVQEKAVEEFTKQGRPILAASTKVDLARDLIFHRDGGKEVAVRAQELLQEAVEIFHEHGATSEFVQAYKLMHCADLQAEDPQAAAAHGFQALWASQHLEEGGVELERIRTISKDLKGLDVRSAMIFLSAGETAAGLECLELGRARFLRSALRLRGTGDAEQQSAISQARAKVIALERAMQKPKASRETAETFVKAKEEYAALERQLPTPSAPIDENLIRRTWRLVERLMQTYGAIVVPIFDAGQSAILVLAMDGEELRASVAFREQDITPMLERWKAASSGDTAALKSAIDVIQKDLWDVFGHFAAQGLVRRKVEFGSRVAIVPQGEFGLLPIGLARDPEIGHSLCDIFELSFAPSIAALDLQDLDEGSPTLAAIINPSEDLPFTPIEAVTSLSNFPSEGATYLLGGECTKAEVLAALRGRSHWLFSAHGVFDQGDARRSGITLSGGQRLTLDDLLSFSDITPPRLVTLSACNSGVHAVENAADEFVGLPVGFLQLGAAGVLGALWPVNDASTALFITAFMDNHISLGKRPAEALQHARSWMRTAMPTEIRGIVVKLLQENIPQYTRDQLIQLDDTLGRIDSTAPVFEHPYYWGGFVLYGN